MAEQKREIIIGRSGSLRSVYSPETDKILRGVANKGGEFSTRRASHVEPTSELTTAAALWLIRNRADVRIRDLLEKAQDKKAFAMDACGNTTFIPPEKWWADMTPLNPDGPVLGPFDDRDTALAEEVKWLQENNIPICEPCRQGQPSSNFVQQAEAAAKMPLPVLPGATPLGDGAMSDSYVIDLATAVPRPPQPGDPAPPQHVEYIEKPFEHNPYQRGYSTPGWYFWDEVGQICYGPYETAAIAEEKIKEYAKTL